GDEPRAVGRCPERRRLSADGRHLIGLVDGAVRVLRLDDNAELSLLASLRGDGSLAVALRDGSGRFDVLGSGAAPVALRRGRVESSTVASLSREGREAGLYARYWRARAAD
ncbi:MAG: hypothetical protein KC668_19295, partial [Myxococcales bacterium]|nr:hypothetical protein [Myxococcales bacterium]